MKKIGVIVPCWNEEESLPLFYQEMTKVMNQMKEQDFEIMFINDGSKDNTLKVIKELEKRQTRSFSFFFAKFWQRGSNLRWTTKY